MARRIVDAALGDMLDRPRRREDLEPLLAKVGLYREVGGDDLFEIREANGEPLFSGGMGGAAFDNVAPNAFAPEYGAGHYVLKPTDAGLDALWCGRQRRYRRLGPIEGEPPSMAQGEYRNDALDMSAKVAKEPAGLVLRTASPFGVAAMSLAQVDHDLFIARPGPSMPGSSVNKDWLFTVKTAKGELVLNNDRTKRLAFRRIR
jgi:D-aminopeptidase